MQTFVLRYRRPWMPFWRKITVLGTSYNPQMDRLSADLPDGSVREFASWSKFHAKLGRDWIMATKKAMEAKAGAAIPINRAGV